MATETGAKNASWQSVGRTVTGCEEKVDGLAMIHNSHDEFVAFVEPQFRQLIAAAPDMLNALEQCVAWEEDYRTRNHLGRNPPHPFTQAKAAIGRAKKGL
jgi:hypothetical protein